jgi:hypothetical protein
MSKAYVETTILADVLLKPKSAKQQKAKAALGRYEETLLPVYSIKEWKAGPLDYFAYFHDKLVQTKSLAKTYRALAALPRGNRKDTSMEALAAAATLSRSSILPGLSGNDQDQADSYRLSIVSLVIRSWRKRRKITSRVTDELACYIESEPHVGKNGLFNLIPQKCDPEQECCLGPLLKAQPQLLDALRESISKTSQRAEDIKRRQALKLLAKHPSDKVAKETCQHLGDAIFAFFCPPDAVVLTTNLRDHVPLAKALGKSAEKP